MREREAPLWILFHLIFFCLNESDDSSTEELETSVCVVCVFVYIYINVMENVYHLIVIINKYTHYHCMVNRESIPTCLEFHSGPVDKLFLV